MLYRKLAKSGLELGIISLGAEHLEKAPYETVAAVTDEALGHGVNYIDLFMPSAGVRDNFGRALKGRTEGIFIAGHLGATLHGGQYFKSRDKAVCERFIDDLLQRLGLDTLGVLMLHFVDEPQDCADVFAADGLIEAALRLKERGKCRLLGMSSHFVPASLRAVESGYLDLLMFPVNPLFDRLPGEVQIEAHWHKEPYDSLRQDGVFQAREELYLACARQGVDIIAMKVFAGGWLFNPHNAFGLKLTPEQCLHYALSQPGVATALAGCSDAAQMRAALAYLEAAPEARDYSIIKTSPLLQDRKACMYCNHCLPCPAGIDIGAVTRLADTAAHGLTPALRGQYGALPKQGAACLDCGQCRDRCPFGLDPAANMRRAEEIFAQ